MRFQKILNSYHKICQSCGKFRVGTFKIKVLKFQKKWGKSTKRNYRLSPSDVFVKSFYVVRDPIVVSTSYKLQTNALLFVILPLFARTVRRLKNSEQIKWMDYDKAVVKCLLSFTYNDRKIIKLNCLLNISQGHLTSRDYFK